MRMMVGLVAVAMACGPSAAEVKTAKLATYHADPAQVFGIVEQVTAETYPIGDKHQEQLELITRPQWFSPDGGRQSAGDSDFVQISDRSVQLSLIVEVVTLSGNETKVVVTPKSFQHISGSPKPRELAPDDPNLPGWVTGRVETLQLAIHKRLEQYARPAQ